MKHTHTLLALSTLALALGLAACSGKQQSDSATVHIGILQQIDQSALDDVRDGFKQEMKTLGYGSKRVEFSYLNANGDQSNLKTMSEKLAGEHNDLNVAIATAAAQAMEKADTTTPMLFTGVADPEATGLIKDAAHPDTNATGVSATVDEAGQIRLLHQMFPKAKTIGLLYNAAEPNSLLHVKNAKREIAKLHLKAVEKTITSTNDVQTATEALVKDADAIYLPADNVVAAAITTVGKITDAAKVPVVPGDATMIKGAGVATRGIDFRDVGKQTARMAVKVLKGQKIKDTPVQDAAVSALVTNKARMKQYGLTAADLK